LLFEDELLLGPFIIEVGKLRRKLLHQLDSLQEELFKTVK